MTFADLVVGDAAFVDANTLILPAGRFDTTLKRRAKEGVLRSPLQGGVNFARAKYTYYHFQLHGRERVHEIFHPFRVGFRCRSRLFRIRRRFRIIFWLVFAILASLLS